MESRLGFVEMSQNFENFLNLIEDRVCCLKKYIWQQKQLNSSRVFVDYPPSTTAKNPCKLDALFTSISNVLCNEDTHYGKAMSKTLPV